MFPGRRVSRVLERCLVSVLAHPLPFSLVVSMLVVGIANFVLAQMHAHLSLGSEAGVEILILFAAVSVPIVLTLTILRSELKTIYDTLNEGPNKAAPILLRFVSEEIRELGEKIADTRSDGVDLEPWVATAWVRDRCFSVASGNFVATDVLVPSVFMALYSDYLHAHRSYLDDTESCVSARINLASTRDLLRDFKNDPITFNRYQRWHTEAGVELLHLDEIRALEIARQCQLRKTLDFALWEEEFALLVKYRKSGETNLRLALVGELAYRRCLHFYERALEEAKPFHEVLENGFGTNEGLHGGRGGPNGRTLRAVWSRLPRRAVGSNGSNLPEWVRPRSLP
jgi:hypothetical protein